MDLSFVFDEAFDAIMSLLIFYVGYSAWRGYKGTRKPNLRMMSVVFLPLAIVHIIKQLAEIMAGQVLEFSDIIDHAVFILSIGFLAWTVRWQPGWKMPLKRQKTD